MEAIDIAATTVLTGADPSGIGGLVLIITVVIIPFIVKFWNWSKETSAQGVLYQQLSEMVQNQRKELDELYKQRRVDQEQIFDLRNKVDHLEEADKTVETLKKKLDQKDQIIAERDARIAGLLEELLKMKDRVHNLELRLKADESQWCENCQYKNTQYISRISNE